MHVVFLGTGGYHPTDQRETNCVLIREAGIVLDAGTGFFRLSHYLQTPRLNILLSHAHLDHLCGIVYLASVLERTATPVEHVALYTPPGVREAVGTLFSEPFFAGSLEKLGVPVSFHEVGEGEFEIEGTMVKAMHLPHRSSGAWGYRLTKGFITIAYVTDTLISETVSPLLQNADLAICESYLRNRQKDEAAAMGHSYPLTVGQTAKRAGVKKLILTHINPALENASSLIEECSLFFPGAQLAADNRIVEL
ncbi:MAG: MBL fold metallo-hydrolase [Candidatus Sumerlaeia bacterium]